MSTIMISWFLITFLLSFVGTKYIAKLALRWRIVDRPASDRKIHNQTKPLLGGLAIYLSLALAIGIILLTSRYLTGGQISGWHYFGFLLGGLILMAGGYLDDRYSLPPWFSIIAPVLAALAAIVFGIEVEKLTNPLGGIIYLAPWVSSLLVFVWLMAVMYTTKFLDGLDGLATGVSGMGAFMIMLLSLSIAYFQPDVALLSALALGAFLGFFFWNFHPAAVFLGEGGSTFVGYTLGILAVISGGKLATLLLVLGIPILDVVWVILRRWSQGGLKQVFKADRKHLHHRLLDLGWSQRRIVLTYLLVAGAFGTAALFLQSREKFMALVILTLLMIIAAYLLVLHEKKQS
ncbi:undecaprenyl/decaprenyl-phosphate alpha-N-acetylglucosaminyl 1-phosphate transferase [Patescibacteria group bacterium]|nr:undecaprenyl/decaprenyl-phosphate alpha-N-acetylglucosaminyl 1-phosphate transferase [Patescibacteria group bacterium]MBU1705922.1 undecaprenyl/decaprenyl-phosphate alpha-N-acetylglucosaminyl 1-phosphate transferase [Patescibacteria group bacterium]